MGRPYQKRCVHCKILYAHWCGSTPYTNDPDNNGTYCPECHKAIRLALEAIPKKRRIKFVETDKFTCMDLDPDTVEPTDLPALEEPEETVSPPPIQVGRVPRIFELGSLSNYPVRELIKAETESLSDMREIDDEAFLASLGEVKPVAVTTRKPDPTEYQARLMTDKAAGSEPPYAHQYLRREYPAGQRREFSDELLPDGALPIYDKAPDIDPPAPRERALLVERVQVSLIDMKDPWNKHKHGYVTRDGDTFYYEWGTRTGKAAGKVSILMEEDIATGEILGTWKVFEGGNMGGAEKPKGMTPLKIKRS